MHQMHQNTKRISQNNCGLETCLGKSANAILTRSRECMNLSTWLSEFPSQVPGFASTWKQKDRALAARAQRRAQGPGPKTLFLNRIQEKPGVNLSQRSQLLCSWTLLRIEQKLNHKSCTSHATTKFGGAAWRVCQRSKSAVQSAVWLSSSVPFSTRSVEFLQHSEQAVGALLDPYSLSSKKKEEAVSNGFSVSTQDVLHYLHSAKWGKWQEVPLQSWHFFIQAVEALQALQQVA